MLSRFKVENILLRLNSIRAQIVWQFYTRLSQDLCHLTFNFNWNFFAKKLTCEYQLLDYVISARSYQWGMYVAKGASLNRHERKLNTFSINHPSLLFNLPTFLNFLAYLAFQHTWTRDQRLIHWSLIDQNILRNTDQWSIKNTFF